MVTQIEGANNEQGGEKGGGGYAMWGILSAGGGEKIKGIVVSQQNKMANGKKNTYDNPPKIDEKYQPTEPTEKKRGTFQQSRSKKPQGLLKKIGL